MKVAVHVGKEPGATSPRLLSALAFNVHEGYVRLLEVSTCDVSIPSPDHFQLNTPNGTGIVQALVCGQPFSTGGIHIKYMLALKDLATSPKFGVKCVAGLSLAPSSVTFVVVTVHPGFPRQCFP